MAHLLGGRSAHVRLPPLWRTCSGPWRACIILAVLHAARPSLLPWLRAAMADALGPLCPLVPVLQGIVFMTV